MKWYTLFRSHSSNATFPCVQCQRASLIATQLNGNKVHLLAAVYANAKNQVRC